MRIKFNHMLDCIWILITSEESLGTSVYSIFNCECSESPVGDPWSPPSVVRLW